MAFFRKRKNKLSIIILLLLITVAGGLYFLFFNPKGALAEWFDSNWFYRQAITITVTSSASDVANLDTWFSMSTSALVSASKMQSDCDDLRFTNANGKLLPYYIDSGCNTTATKIWIKIDLVPKNSTTYTVYAYYGNPNATAATDSTKFRLYNGLVGYWNMNEASWTVDCTTTSVKDLSVNANNGKSCPTSTGPAGGATGKYGNGGLFDGSNDYVDAGNNSSLNFTTSDFTIGMWVNPTTLSGHRDLFIRGLYQTDGYRFRIDDNQALHLATYQSGVAQDTYTANSTIGTGSWVHLVATRIGAAVKIYKNGVDITSTAATHVNPTTSARTAKIGIYDDATLYPFNGLIDDIRIYNRALSATEVSQLYSDSTSSILTAVQGQSVPSVSFATEEKGPAPVAYWRFDEGQGLTAYDDSSNNNDGTLSGSTKPTWQTGDMCVSGKCLKFDGSTSYVDVGTINPLPDGTGTVSVWFKLTNGAIGKNNYLITKGSDATSLSWGLDVIPADATSCNIVLLYGTGDWVTTGNVACSLANWHLFTVVMKSNNTQELYLDGILKTTGTKTVITPAAGSHLVIGEQYRGDPYGYQTNGFLDDLKIYPYARTAQQIRADFNSRSSQIGTSARIGSSNQWLSDGLIGYWKMDEVSGAGSTLADSSGAGNTGTAKLWGGGNTATDSAHVAGKYGNAFSFDGGDDYVDAGSNASLNITNGTISFWAKPTNTTQSGVGFVSKRNGSAASNFDYTVRQMGANIRVQLGDGASIQTFDGTTSSLTTAWQHIIVTFNSSTVTIYRNGIFLESTPQTIVPSGVTKPLYIGADEPADGYFNGSVDDLRIYNRALSPKEISDLYNWAPGPVGYWRMDDKVSGNSQTLVDSSTYANTGTTYYGANATGMNCKVIGKYGGGCLFDGVDDYVDMGTSASSLNVANAITIGHWVKTPATLSHYGETVVNIPTDNTKYGGYRIYLNTDWTFTFLFSTNGTTWNGSVTSNVKSANTWYYVAATYDKDAGSSNAKLYINGVSENPQTVTGAIDYTQTPFRFDLGMRSDLWDGSSFKGSIDDVRVYNYARTPSQILADYGTGQAQKQPAAWWKFDEGHDNTIYDQSVNANTGTNHGASWTNNGKFGKALSFDGVSSYVDAGDPSNGSLDPSSALTIAAWINTRSSASAYRPHFVCKGESGSQGSYCFVIESGTTGLLRLWLDVGSGWSNAVTGVADLKSSSYLNKWTFVTAVYDGATAKIYVNGVLDNSASKTGSIRNSAANLFIGRDPWLTANQIFNGSIDEVKIYPFALTASDIQTEYNRGSALKMGSFSDTSGLTGGAVASDSASALYCIPGDTATCTAPVGEWKFDEKVSGNSQTVYDTSGSGNNGTTAWGANASGMNCKVPGKYGSACNFDGTDDYVDAGQPSSLNFTGNAVFTIEAWIRTTNNGQDQAIVAKADGFWSNHQYAFTIENDEGGKLTFSANTDTGWVNYINNTVITNNQWHYVVVAVDGASSEVKFYLDGVYDGNNVYGGRSWKALKNYAQPVTIGKFAGDQQKFIGFIDDVQIYNYVRTPAQIAWDYNRGKPIGWWKFDECQGTTAYDSSGNSNTGTITIGGSGTQTTVGTCAASNAAAAWYNGLSGKFNSAMSFDGVDDYVQVAHSYSYDSYTFSFWLKRTAAGVNNPRIITPTDTHWVLWDMGHSKGIGFYGTNAVAPSDPVLNTWEYYSIVFNRSSSYAYIYKDGVLVGEGAVTRAAPSGNWIIGHNETVATNVDSWPGLIDDVKIFNYALTPLQVKLDYNQSAAVRFGPSSGRP